MCFLKAKQWHAVRNIENINGYNIHWLVPVWTSQTNGSFGTPPHTGPKFINRATCYIANKETDFIIVVMGGETICVELRCWESHCPCSRKYFSEYGERLNETDREEWKDLEKRYLPVPQCPQQIPHERTCASRNRTSVLRSRRLIAWFTARSKSNDYVATIGNSVPIVLFISHTLISVLLYR